MKLPGYKEEKEVENTKLEDEQKTDDQGGDMENVVKMIQWIHKM